MQKIILCTLAFIAAGIIYAQRPVNWSFTSKKTGDKMYEVYLTASVNVPWHIYSQSTPDGGPLPTTVHFNKNPLVILQGKLEEKGKLLQKYEEVFDMNVKYFDGNVNFVQLIKLKGNVKTTISGKVEFMACNDEQCLPPAEVPFTIQLN